MLPSAIQRPPTRTLALWRSGHEPLWALAIVAVAVVAASIAWDLGRWRTDVRAPAPFELTRPPSPRALDQRTLPISTETAVEANASRPIVAGPIVPARPFRFTGSPEMLERATDCLAAVAWYEAGDDADGQRTVMQVVLNRARHPSFPPTICGVVFEGSSRRTGCQFTFTCDGAITSRTPPATAWQRARALGKAALAGAVDPRVGYATFYHANYVVPYWAASFDKIAQIGLHLVYRWRGYWGMGAAFRQQHAGDEPAIAAMVRFAAAETALDGAPGPSTGLTDETTGPPAPAAPPPPIAVEGVRAKSLRGAQVRGLTDNQFFLQLDPASFPGNYATAAVALCKGKPTCTVLGWRDPAQMGAAFPLSDAQRSALSFYFAQGAEGAFTAQWNCQQTPRTNRAQCLGVSGPLPQPS